MTKLLGARIRQARKGANLSQSQLAGKIGAHVTSVSDWERGRNAPSARHLLAIAKATGTRMEHFEEDDEESDPVAELFTALDRFVDHKIQRGRLSAASEGGRPG